MKCVNISHPDFKKLLEETGKDSFELETDIVLWQDRTGSDEFPEASDIRDVYYSTEEAKSLPDAEVNQKLTELLNKSGISVSKQKVYAEGYETRNGKPLSVAGKADLTNNLIEYDLNKAGKNTLAEEAMHFVTADNEGTYDFNRAMRLVEQHPDYQELYNRYYPIYKSDYKTKMEILGKVGAPILNERIKSPLLRYLKRMLDRVLAKLGNSKAELRMLLDKFGQTFIESGIQNELTGTFYDIGDVGYIAKAKKIYEGIVKGMYSKLNTEQQKGYKPYKLEKAYYDILDADHTKGMLMFVDYMKEDAIEMVRFFNKVRNKEEVITHEKLSQAHHAIMFYKKNLQRLQFLAQTDLKNSPELTKKEQTKLKKQIKKISELLLKVEADHRVQTKILARGFANSQARETIQDKQRLEQELNDIKQAIDNVDYDMNQLMYWVGSLAHTKDAIVKGLHAAIVKANQRINRFGYRLGQELIGKSNELGVKDMVSLMEKSDGKHTGFLQTRLKRGAWQLAFDAERRRMHEKYDLPIGNKAEERELRQQIKHEWRQAALEYNRLYKELGDRDKALEALTDKAAYEKGMAYRTEWAKWFNRNTRPVANLNEIINEKKKTLSKEDYEYWYNQNVGRAANGDLYYKNELIEPSDGSMSAKKENRRKVKTVDWTNYDYNKLSQSQKDMIEYLESKLKEADAKHTKIRQNYRLPQVRASFVNMLKDKKFGNIGDQIKEEFQRVEDDTEYGEKVTYSDGTVAKFVPMHFVTPLENPDTISTDLLYSVMLYGRQAEDFKTKSSLEPVFQTVLRQLGERTVKNETGLKSEAYKTVEKFIDMNIYGERKDDFMVGGVNVSKALGKLKNYVTANNLVFNLFTTVAGYMTANVYSKIEDLVGQYTNQKAKNKAEITFDTNVHKALLELGRPNKTSKLAVFFEEHGIIKESEQTLKNLDLSRLSRAAINSGLYAQYEIVKYRVRGKLALALAHDLKYVKNEQKFFTTNELKSQGYSQEQIDGLPDYWDMHEVKDSKLVAKHKDKTVFERYANKVDYIGNNLEGELDSSDYAAAHQHAVLQLVTTHRGWLFRNVQLRFKPKGINYITGQEEVGYYSGFFDFVKSTFFGEQRIKDLKSLINRWQELDNTERYAVRKTMYELAFVNAIASIAFILNGVADDDDESWLKQYLAYQSNRILLEVSALNPFPAIAVGPEGVRLRPPIVGSVNEIVEILNSPIAATRQLEDLQDLMYIFSSEEIERGPYEGMTKAERAVLKLGIGTKGYYQARSAEAIESSNRFLKNKTLEWLK